MLWRGRGEEDRDGWGTREEPAGPCGGALESRAGAAPGRRSSPREDAGASPAAGEEEEEEDAPSAAGTALSEWRPDLIITMPVSLGEKTPLGCCFQLCSSSPSFRPLSEPP